MGVYKRKGSKFYWFRFIHKGRRVQKSTKQGDKETAKQMESAERTRLARIDAGIESPEPKLRPINFTVAELLDGLESHYGLEGKASSKNLSTIRRAREAFGKFKASEFSTEEVDKFIRQRLATGAANATINRLTEVVKRAFKVAKMQSPEIRHLSEKDNVRRGFFTVQEFEDIVKHLPEALQDFCRFGFITGWRKGEISTLRWPDIEDGVIRLRSENSKNREARHVPIEGELVELIKRRRGARAVKTPDGLALANYVFHRGGQQVREFRKSWTSACKAAKVHRLFHDLRRSAVRNMIRGGISMTIAMRISGHKTANMFRRYDICDERDLKDAMKRVEEYHKIEADKVVLMSGQ
jgi:integrase